MELLRFIPIKLTALVVGGILTGHFLRPPPEYPLIAAVLCIFVLGTGLRGKQKRFSRGFGITAALTTYFIGISAFSLSREESGFRHYLNHNVQGVKLLHVKVREVLKANRFSRNYIAEIKALDSDIVEGTILLRLTRDEFSRECRVDDEIVVAGILNPITGPRNPHQFDYRHFLERKGIYHQLQPTNDRVSFLEPGATTLKGLAARIRNTISGELSATGFSPDELAVVQALLLGQRQELPDDVYDSYKYAGAVHILAVSGLHIGILLYLLHFLFRPLERISGGKTLKLLVLLCFLWFYALLAGLSASIIRAVTMFSFVAYALYLNRPSNTFNILALSMFFVLLAFNPGLLLEAGFQMSYAAVISILWIYPRLQSAYRPRFWLFRKTWQLLSVSVAAQLGVLPVSLYYFHQFPGLFFVTNLLVVPFLGIVLGAGFLISLLSLFRWLPVQLAATYEAMISLMNRVVAWVAGQESFLFREIPFDLLMVALVYLALISLCMVLNCLTFKRVIFLLLNVLALQLWHIYKAVRINSKEVVWVMHQYRTTSLFHQVGHRLTVATQTPSKVSGLVSDFRVGEAINDFRQVPISNIYRWDSGELIVVNEHPGYPLSPGKSQYLLLSSSPRINLDRMLEESNPKVVIADGSNYPSYISRWRKSCMTRGIPFHDTATDGAFRLAIQ